MTPPGTATVLVNTGFQKEEAAVEYLEFLVESLSRTMAHSSLKPVLADEGDIQIKSAWDILQHSIGFAPKFEELILSSDFRINSEDREKINPALLASIDRINRLHKGFEKKGYRCRLFTEYDSFNLQVTVPHEFTDRFAEDVKETLEVPDYVANCQLPIEVYENLLSRDFSEITPYSGEGKMRKTFLATRGKQKIIVKIDSDPENKNNTQKDVEVLQNIPEPEKNHLAKLMDYIDLSRHGKKGFVLLEEFVENSVSLAHYLKEKGTLSAKEAETVLPMILQGMNHLYGNGFMHRDLNESNILLVKDESSRITDVRITDHANAAKKDTLDTKASPTMGGRTIQDPLKMSLFTGEKAKYDLESELHAFGIQMYKALTGRGLFAFDEQEKTATINGTNVLNEEGLLDYDKCEESLEDGLLSAVGRKAKEYAPWLLDYLPDRLKYDPKVRKYAQIIKRLLSLKQRKAGHGYQSIDDVIKDFETAKNGKPIERELKFFGKTVLPIVLFGSAAMGTLLWYNNKVMTFEFTAKSEQIKQELTSSYYDYNAESEQVYSPEYSTTISVCGTGKSSSDLADFHKKNGFIRLSPGEEIWLSVVSKELRRQKKYQELITKAYIEGQKECVSKRITIVQNIAQVETYPEMSYGFGFFEKILVPPTMSPGVHNLVIETYRDDSNKESQALTRDIIPVVVGEPQPPLAMNSIEISWYAPSRLELRRLDEKKADPEQVKLMIEIPELNYSAEQTRCERTNFWKDGKVVEGLNIYFSMPNLNLEQNAINPGSLIFEKQQHEKTKDSETTTSTSKPYTMRLTVLDTEDNFITKTHVPICFKKNERTYNGTSVTPTYFAEKDIPRIEFSDECSRR